MQQQQQALKKNSNCNHKRTPIYQVAALTTIDMFLFIIFLNLLTTSCHVHCVSVTTVNYRYKPV
jgi:hypothetical protein